jgi:hypothetical protein
MRLFSWGPQGGAFIDRWTIVHLSFWLVIGANMEALGIPQAWRWPLILVGALLWEVAETALEKYTNVVAEPESYLNRWVSDPIMGFLGGGIGMYLIGG